MNCYLGLRAMVSLLIVVVNHVLCVRELIDYSRYFRRFVWANLVFGCLNVCFLC